MYGTKSLYHLNETRQLGIIAIGNSAVVTVAFLMCSMKYNPDTNNGPTTFPLRRMRKPADNALMLTSKRLYHFKLTGDPATAVYEKQF
jgi:hypothetical protein